MLSQDFERSFQPLCENGADPHMRLYNYVSRDKYVHVVRQLEREPFSSVLEVGFSGLGLVLKRVAPQLRVVALSKQALFEKPEDSEVEHLEGDLLNPPLNLEERFDVVLFCDVIEHLQGNPRIAMRELARLLRPGGRLVLTTPNLVRLSHRVRFALGRTVLERIGDPPNWAGHIREYVMEEICDFASDAGLRVEHREYPLYWDSMRVYLTAGPRGHDDQGRFYHHPRYRGLRKWLAMPALLGARELVRAFPSLRTPMLIVARR